MRRKSLNADAQLMIGTHSKIRQTTNLLLCCEKHKHKSSSLGKNVVQS